MLFSALFISKIKLANSNFDYNLLLILLGTLLLSSSYSSNQLDGFLGALIIISFCLFLLIYSSELGFYCLSSEIIKLLKVLVVVSWIVYVFIPGFGVTVQPYTGETRMSGLFHPNTLAKTSGVLVLFILTENRLMKDWLYAVISLLAILLSGGKTALIALFIVMGIYVLKEVRIDVRLWFGALLLSFFSILILFPEIIEFIFILLSRSGSISEITSLSGRGTLWTLLVLDFINSPIFGYGFGAVGIMTEQHALNYGFWKPGHSHNTILEVVLSGGVIAGLPLIIIYLKYIYKSVTFQLKGFDYIIVYLLICGFSAPLISHKPDLTSLMFLCFLLLNGKKQENYESVS
ncbi:MAG: hypothetical protein CMP48_02535 [Rickettsiales bacterium]|nr:hypothetical protein [Rickettsiales bacterium]